jgi:hypothetical protein
MCRRLYNRGNLTEFRGVIRTQERPEFTSGFFTSTVTKRARQYRSRILHRPHPFKT